MSQTPIFLAGPLGLRERWAEELHELAEAHPRYVLEPCKPSPQSADERAEDD